MKAEDIIKSLRILDEVPIISHGEVVLRITYYIPKSDRDNIHLNINNRYKKYGDSSKAPFCYAVGCYFSGSNVCSKLTNIKPTECKNYEEYRDIFTIYKFISKSDSMSLYTACKLMNYVDS